MWVVYVEKNQRGSQWEAFSKDSVELMFSLSNHNSGETQSWHLAKS